ncbi:hypothetical protein ISF6_0232 [Piscinibacter sakaiensis]|uniref:Uncharacterized protein n=1 Tax=Piscinibacter sakaiensis TaxID=1547922 RepID=A0A0K8P8S9_PISS1|nr:hypothetical protein ISF6_0232 [Piscinibacter sakaiensis]
MVTRPASRARHTAMAMAAAVAASPLEAAMIPPRSKTRGE